MAGIPIVSHALHKKHHRDLEKAIRQHFANGTAFRYYIALHNKHRRTLQAIFDEPIRSDIEWKAVEAMLMEYKGYIGVVEFDDSAGIFHGDVVNTRDVITFQGKSVAEIKKAFHESVDDYLAFCKERGEQPDKPFSGRLVVRMAPELHRALATAARREKKSLNSLIVDKLGHVGS